MKLSARALVRAAPPLLATLGVTLLPPSAFTQVPEFVHGDECLFCHRNDIGPGWQKNAHGLALRQEQDAPELIAILKAEPKLAKFAAETTHTLGSRHHVRFLKQSGYGKFDILSARADLDKPARWEGLDNPQWQRGKFEMQCVGCHATGVDPKTRTFTAIGHDCFVCHGVVDLEHTNDTSKIFLSKKRRGDAQAITAACAQCHLRGAKAQSTGLPYPTSFVAGAADLFKDYAADFTKQPDNPGDRHVWQNVRDVVNGNSDVTCLSCHRIHQNSTDRHRRVLTGEICLNCHNAQGPKKEVKRYEVHSVLCEY
jgi:predicted CXXCH cytochrome family protein